jgi:hypothetical protein
MSHRIWSKRQTDLNINGLNCLGTGGYKCFHNLGALKSSTSWDDSSPHPCIESFVWRVSPPFLERPAYNCYRWRCHDVPAFRLALSLPAAVATSSRIPNATTQTVPHEAAMVPDLGRGQRARAAYARSDSGDAIGTAPGVFPMECCWSSLVLWCAT